jgi:hypothetical protein
MLRTSYKQRYRSAVNFVTNQDNPAQLIIISRYIISNKSVFFFISPVQGVEESIVNASRITDHESAV